MEFIPGICWIEFWTKKSNQVNALINAGFKSIRLFFNLCDLPYNAGLIYNSSSLEWQSYINHVYMYSPNPMHAWTFEGSPSPNTTTETLKDHIDFCKKYNWLPIICMGYQEELPHNFLGRAPKQQYWNWLGRFAKEFAIFLKDKIGFKRADLEIWNEPTKLQGLGFGYDKYCVLAYKMGMDWKSISGYKLHVFADDILWQYYLDEILKDKNLMKITDYISTHIGLAREDEEWDNQLIAKTTQKIKSKYPHLRQAVTEMSLNGRWDRLNQLPDNVNMYGIIGAIRSIESGTATRIDDIWMWGPGDELQITAPQKAQTLKTFNEKYYKPYSMEGLIDMIELNYVKAGTVNEETRTVQEILIDSGYVVSVTGKCDENTVKSIKEFQADNELKVDGWVGKLTWNKFLSECATGLLRFLQLITRTAKYK